MRQGLSILMNIFLIISTTLRTITTAEENLHVVHSGHFRFLLPRNPTIIAHTATTITDIIPLFQSYKGRIVAFPSDPSETGLFIEAKYKFGYTVAVANLATMLMLEDKKKFIEFCRKDSFLSDFVPKSYENIDEVQYPVVLKLDMVNAGSIGIQLVHDKDKLSSLISNVSSHTYQLQEAIPGHLEFCYYFGAFQGKLLPYQDVCMNYTLSEDLVINRAQENKKKVKSFFTNCESIDNFESAKKAAIRIVQLSDFHGFGCFQFKVFNGQVKFWEINPRMCGGISRSSVHFQGFLLSWWEKHVEIKKRIFQSRHSRKQLITL